MKCTRQVGGEAFQLSNNIHGGRNQQPHRPQDCCTHRELNLRVIQLRQELTDKTAAQVLGWGLQETWLCFGGGGCGSGLHCLPSAGQAAGPQQAA